MRAAKALPISQMTLIERPFVYKTEIESKVFADIETAIDELRAGRMIVVVDDEDRENEGDLIMAAANVTPEAINFMATHGRGLICLAITGERADDLELAPMTSNNTSTCGTAFTISIDATGRGVTTGVSTHDRAETILAAIDPETRPGQLARPGHVFPLRACRHGVLGRRGHTEAAVDLARLAGLHPSGVICEILNEDGSMSRVPDLVGFCLKHNLKMIMIEDLARHRLTCDPELFGPSLPPEGDPANRNAASKRTEVAARLTLAAAVCQAKTGHVDQDFEPVVSTRPNQETSLKAQSSGR